MEAIIKYSEFFKNDGGFKKTKEDFVKLGDELIEKAKEVREKTKFLSVNDSKGIQKVVEVTKTLTDSKKEYADILKKIEVAEKKLDTLRKKTPKAITVESEALKKRNKELRLVAQIQNTTKGSIENLRVKLGLVTIAWSKLSEKERENTKRGRRLIESKKQLNAELLKLEKRTGDNRRQVGAYEKGLGRLRGSFIGLAQAAGVTLGLFGAFRVIKNATSIVRDFEKQNATLAGVLQKEKGEIQELVEDSKRLGSITIKTAGEVAGLQTEYARLGFTQQEILDLTEPTINGSIALNAELSETSMLVGAIANSYDELGAIDAPEIIDILSLATAKSALNFQKLSVGLPIVLGAANALNVPLTEVTATLGKLADAGIETSTGATSLRNIFIESAARGINYKDALNLIRNSTDKLTTANNIFGKRAAVSALVIAKNAVGVSKLTEELEDAAGTAERMAEKELATLDGSIKLLTSAWEGLILEMNDATDGGNILSNTIRFLAENLQTIFKVVGITTTAWLTYLLTVKAISFYSKIELGIQALRTKATIVQTAATNGATVAQKSFNVAAKANPLGLVIALLAAAVTAYYAFRDSATSAEKAQRAFNKAKKESKEDVAEIIKEEKEPFNKKISSLKDEFLIRRAAGEDSDKLDREFIKRKKEILLEENKINISKIRALEDAFQKSGEVEKQRISDAQKNTIKLLAATRGSGFGIISRGKYEVQSIKNNEASKRGVLQLEYEERIKLTKFYQKQISQLSKDAVIEIKKQTVNEKEAYSARIKELQLLRRRLEDLRDGSINGGEKREIQQTTRKFNREIKAIKGKSKIEIDLRNELESEKQRQINDIRNKYKEERLSLLTRGQGIERGLIEDDNKRQIALETEKSKKLIKEIEKNSEIEANKKLFLIDKINEKLKKFKNNIFNNNKLRELENEKLISEALIEQRRGEFKTEKEYEDFKNAEFLKIQGEYLKKRLELLQSIGGDQYKVEIEQLKAQIANLDIPPPKIDKWKEFADEMRDVMTKVGVEIEKVLQTSVENSKKNLTEQQKAVDLQRSRAEKGLTNTLAFEQKEQAKKESALLKRQKKLDRVQKLRSYWNTYNANINSLKTGEDSSKAILKTLRDIAVMQSITSSLASFGDGGLVADRVPTDGRGITRGRSHQGRMGGIPVLVEGNEGFFSGREVDNLGKDNFYALKEMAGRGPLGANVFKKQRIGFESSVDNFNDRRIVEKLDNVTRAIQEKPEQSLDVLKMVEGMLHLVETTKKGNTTVRNHHKISRKRL